MSIAIVNAPCSCQKVVFVSRREALTMAKGMRSVAHQQRAYRCDGGYWHLTSKPTAAKTRRVQNVTTDDREGAIRERRERVTQRRVNRAAIQAKQGPAIPAKVAVLPAVHDKTRCVNPACRRPWLSDLNPEGRACPSCGSGIKIGKADRFKDWVRSVAA